MKTATITLAGQTHTINELPRKQNAAWRERFQAMFRDVADLIEELADSDLNAETVGRALNQIVAKVGGSVDMLADLVFAYAPRLDKEKLEEEVYDSELMAAFTAVLELAYPFGSVLKTVQGLAELGRKADSTSTN